MSRPQGSEQAAHMLLLPLWAICSICTHTSSPESLREILIAIHTQDQIPRSLDPLKINDSIFGKVNCYRGYAIM